MHADRFLLQGHRFVQAGAGTGKTHALVTQYLHLCAGFARNATVVSPSALVVLTFTDKAAHELRTRILQRVQRLREALVTGTDWQALEPELAATQQRQERVLPGPAHWQQVEQALYEAPLGTFHTVAGTWVRTHALALGTDAASRVLDESDAYALHAEAAGDTIRAALRDEIETVSAQEAAALVATYGFTGTAEFPGLVAFVMHICNQRREQGWPLVEQPAAPPFPWQTHWLQTLNQLQQFADELASLRPQLGPSSQALLSQPPPATLEDPAATAKAWHTWCHTMGALRAKPRSETVAVLAHCKEQLRTHCERLHVLTTTRLTQSHARAFDALCASTHQAYQHAKRTRKSWDFTDLLHHALRLLRQPTLGSTVRSSLRAVLVDESQDINPLQAQLLTHLVWDRPWAPSPPSDVAHEAGPSLYIVGDRKQSIYQFRGADVGLFVQLRQWVLATNGHEESLQHSYRSTPALVAFANAFFGHVFAGPTPHPFETTWMPDTDPLRAARTLSATEPAAEWLLAPSGTPHGISTEAALIATRLQQLAHEGHPWSHMVLLLRRMTHAHTYATHLQQAGIPVHVFQPRGALHTQEMYDLLAALRLVVDPTDSWAWWVVLRSTLCACSDRTLLLFHQRNVRSLADWQKTPLVEIRLPPAEQERLEHMTTFLLELHRFQHVLVPSLALSLVCQEFALLSLWQALPQGAARCHRAQQLLTYARQCEEENPALAAFVERMRRLIASDNQPEPAFADEPVGENVVRLMTIHQSKGLEFPIVVIPGCAQPERTVVPRISYHPTQGVGFCLTHGAEKRRDWIAYENEQLQQRQTHAESARLLYVAVTRAQERVVFVGETRPSGFSWRQWLSGFSESEAGGALQTRVLAAPPLQSPPESTASPHPSEETTAPSETTSH